MEHNNHEDKYLTKFTISSLNSPSTANTSASENLRILKRDNIHFSVRRAQSKLPFVCLSLNVTLTEQQLKRIFLKEMKK